ncbi:MAG: HNH endonuclease [Candidatus Riflebacteria bacterium]|nr:HNH endonuclease [Candidatus Riflebacteria bacterium]
MTKNNWSYNETLLAFNLYCKIPFGRINYRNPDIINLAEIIGRTPSSVAMKMVNLASLDPELQKRGIKGLSNNSKIEKEIWNDFNIDSTALIIQANELLKQYKSTNSLNFTEINKPIEEDLIELPKGSNLETITTRRLGQVFFRRCVLASYDYKCCVTGINVQQFLVASHIKPWVASDDKTEKTNPRNGLCLNSLHDKAFDCGLISLDTEFRIIVSNKFKELNTDNYTKELILGFEGKKRELPGRFVPDINFIKYHNEYVFKQ